MYTFRLILLIFTLKTYLCSDINDLFDIINKEYETHNAIAAEISWDSSIDPGYPALEIRSKQYQKNLIIWQQRTCDGLATLEKSQLLNETQLRQTYLLCRGPKFTYQEARTLSNLYEELQSIYSNAEVCVPIKKYIAVVNLTSIENAILNYLDYIEDSYKIDGFGKIPVAVEIASKQTWKKNTMVCISGEDEFQNIMAFSRNEEVVRFLWLVWREKVGPPMRRPYRMLVEIENRAARRNGYGDIGESWREDLEIPNLRQLCWKLYYDILPLYKTLHGVVRYYLRKYYGNIVPERGPIPAHLLGNMWAENWDSLMDVILKDNIKFDEEIKENNWTVLHMVKRAEDFYQSLSLPAMTDAFWRESIFKRENHPNARCHGAAADMFKDGDFRLLYCADVSMENFYVLHHELGHIQYFMAYAHQPAIFRQANKAFHEAIGDTIMYGVMTPQHLHRLGLINDTTLYAASNNSLLLELRNTEEKSSETSNIRRPKLEVSKRDDINYETEPSNDLELKINKDSIQIKTNDKEFKIYHPNNFRSDDEMNIDFDKRDTNRNFFKNGDTMYDIKLPNFAYENINTAHFEPRKVIEKQSAHTGKDEKSDYKITKISLEDALMLKQALNKIPQLAFALLIDEYRWRYFKGSLRDVNEDFWDLALELQGVVPPGRRGEVYFDAGAKFHVPDNTPYIRYFLSGFLQHQLLETLCKAAVFGRRNADEPVPDTIAINKCDIYGSKTVGKILKDFMSRGDSQSWRDILEAVIGERAISSAALVRYYKPLFKLLHRIVHEHRIPIGW